MKFRFLLFVGIALAVTSCKKDRNMDGGGPDPVLPVAPKPFTITEDFESGVKTSYDADNVTLATGSWNLDGALLGTDKSDVKNGRQDVRIQGTNGNTKRNGILSMNFNIKHVTSVSVKSALTNFADKQKPGPNVTTLLKGYWELQSSKDGGKTYTKVGATVNPTDTATLATTTFMITDTAAQRFRIVNTSDLNGSNRVRISIDDITFNGMGDAGVIVGTPDTNPVDTTATSTATTPRGVTIGADAPPASGDNNNLLFGNPSGANNALLDNYLLNQGYYTESYSSSRGTPNWVSWHLDATNTTNATGRLDNFAGFNGLPSSMYVVQSNSYSGTGFDRGHNCPSADRTSSANANAATFLMTNMIPQAPQNNQQTWNNLEGYLRNQVGAGNEVYIIMGSYGTGGVGSKSTATVTTIDNGHVTVPSNVWKVAIIIPNGNGDLLRVTNNTRVIAVNTPNVNSINTDWTRYIVSVRDIEKATGYNLLSSLPQSVQDAIEVKVDAGI